MIKKQIDTLVISGGGFKGIAYCGVLKKLKELEMESSVLKIDIKKICCVSIGAFFGLLYILNYDYDELEEEILNKDFNTLKDVKITNFISNYGFDNGNGIINWLETLIIKKGYHKTITFKELYNKTNVIFQVLATNLNYYSQCIFDYENTPELSVIEGIRMSISLPFIFTKQTYNNDIYVDGGIINNYPIDLFKDKLDTVLGIRLVSGFKESHRYEIDKLDTYIYNIMSCMLVQKEKYILESELYKKHTVYVYTKDVTSTIKFDISKRDKLKLIKIGYNSINNYFKCGK